MPGAEGWSNRLTSRFWDGGNLLPRWRRHRLALKTETLVVEVASLLCTVHCSKYMPSSMSSEPYPVKGWPIATSPYCRPITLDGFAPTLTMATSWRRWYLLRCQLLLRPKSVLRRVGAWLVSRYSLSEGPLHQITGSTDQRVVWEQLTYGTHSVVACLTSAAREDRICVPK